MSDSILALDQGTTSSRALVFDRALKVIGLGQEELPQHYPASGWVEHDAEDIWRGTIDTARAALKNANVEPSRVAAIGITNQRETTVVWDRRTGKPIHKAIVWQDRRTADVCERLKADGAESTVSERTGLVLDPYFSATKIAWLLDNVEGARAAAEAGHLLAGTVDSFLIWRLTGGKAHVTDATNASRTALFDIRENHWDEDLCRIFRVPRAMLPEVRDCAADFGTTEAGLLGAPIPIRGVAGDQQSALVGQGCFTPGMMKSTYGTGCFAVLNTGSALVRSKTRLLSTIGFRLDGQTAYALEGSIFVAGAAVQWLRDGLKVLHSAAQTGPMAAASDPAQDVYMVPAFVGLGAPHWEPRARGALFGLTRATGPAELARAALEAVCYQTRDLLEAMRRDWPACSDVVLRVDGGMVANDWTMQFLADVLAARVDRPTMLETTALGAAWLAGHNAGVLPDREGFQRSWQLDRSFLPAMAPDERERRYRGWRSAVAATLAHASTGTSPDFR
ncbi:MAG: glycerol kinase GlpK [Hyphomicrobiaceae bacterium]